MASILSRALALRRKHPTGQFRQPQSAKSGYGASGCTDTCLQFLGRLVKGLIVTHDQIRTKVGHKNPRTGLNSTEVGAWLRAEKLPYKVAFNLTATQMLAMSRRGPVLVAEMYSHHPEWKGYRYQGVTANSKPNGYARPLGKRGKNQLRGFSGRHAIVLLGYTDSTHVYVMEPNHNSTARPEKVTYDVITVAQFKALVAAWKASVGNTYCAYPTKAL